MTTGGTKPFHNPFGSLSELRSQLPDGPAAREERAADPAARPAASGIPRAVVRLERSGRGGKDVTVIEHLTLGAAERDVWLKALKAALGCGGALEADAIVLQGDHRKRLPAMLSARGVRKVTVSGSAP